MNLKRSDRRMADVGRDDGSVVAALLVGHGALRHRRYGRRMRNRSASSVLIRFARLVNVFLSELGGVT